MATICSRDDRRRRFLGCKGSIGRKGDNELSLESDKFRLALDVALLTKALARFAAWAPRLRRLAGV
jgi:hypothetical protein